MLALLWRRLVRLDGRRVAARVASATEVLRLVPDLERPGESAPDHSFWTFPVLAASPDGLVRHLRAHGFDATRGQWSLYAVPAPDAERRAVEAEEVMSQIVYLPVYPEVTRAELGRLAEAVQAYRYRAGSATNRSRQPALQK
jgi:dTDP-4-amino-4,6-dideoxygalactose transaminase